MILFFSRILTAKGRPESKSWANLTLPKLPSPNVLPSSYLPSRIPSCFFSAITIHCITSRPSNKLSKIGFCIRVYLKLWLLLLYVMFQFFSVSVWGDMRYEVWDSRLFNGGPPLYGLHGAMKWMPPRIVFRLTIEILKRQKHSTTSTSQQLLFFIYFFNYYHINSKIRVILCCVTT